MKINLSAVAPRILVSRGTPFKFILYALKDLYAKFGAFTLTDWTISQNIASNSHSFGHTDSRAGLLGILRSGQSYHRPPVNSSQFLVANTIQ